MAFDAGCVVEIVIAEDIYVMDDQPTVIDLVVQ